MDSTHFDRLMREFAGCASGRGLLPGLSTLPLVEGLTVFLKEGEGEAKRRKNRRRAGHRHRHGGHGG